ncbi:MAG TPA: hypothetical protein VI895_01265 [Bdellovibrionota bacterium]|nr:hypothetical protein [Bdellovibrionota bacterium]
MKPIGPQAFGDRKGPKALRHVRQGVFDQVFRPEENSLLVARGTEQSGLSGKGNDSFLLTGITRIDGHPLPGIATDQEPIARVVDA